LSSNQDTWSSLRTTAPRSRNSIHSSGLGGFFPSWCIQDQSPGASRAPPGIIQVGEFIVVQLPMKFIDGNFDILYVMVLQLGPQHSGWPAQTLSTSSRSSSSCNSNTSSSSTSESALQAVAPDTPDRRTAQVLAARWAARQE
jgi:hypothetical protein